MVNKYPVSAVLDAARRNGMTAPWALPAGHRLRDHGWPADWVLDPPTNMIMPRQKFDELARERRSFAAEQTAQQVASARSAIRELETDCKRLTAELVSFVGDLQKAIKTDPDDVAAILALTRSITDRANSRAATMSTLVGQRMLIQDLAGKASNAAPAPDDKASQ
jgi:hypothetical protein